MKYNEFYKNSLHQGFYWEHGQLNLIEYYQFLISTLRKLELLFGIEIEVACANTTPKPTNLSKIALEYFLEFDDVILDKKVANKKVMTDCGKETWFSPIGFVSTWHIKSRSELIMELSLTAGGSHNAMLISFLKHNDIISGIPEFNRQLFEKFILYTNPEYAVFTSKKLRKRIDPNGLLHSTVGWLTFFNKRLRLDSSNVHISYFNDGTLIQIEDKYLGEVSDECLHLLLNVQEELVTDTRLLN